MDAIFPAKSRRKYLQWGFYDFKNRSWANSPTFFMHNQILIQLCAHYHEKQISIFQIFYFNEENKIWGKCSQVMGRWKVQHLSGITTFNSEL